MSRSKCLTVLYVSKLHVLTTNDFIIFLLKGTQTSNEENLKEYVLHLEKENEKLKEEIDSLRTELEKCRLKNEK